MAVASTAEPVDFGAADGKPITLIFLVVSPANGAAAHLQALARVSRMLRLPGVAARLREAPDAGAAPGRRSVKPRPRVPAHS